MPLGEIEGAAPRLDLAAIRAKLAGKRGREYWRSLEEVADTDAFQEYLQREFPMQAPRDMAPLNRRDFMRVMGATLALAGVGGCAYQPPEQIVPYVEQPENQVPGKPLFYATAFPRGGYAYGVLAESQMGRPIKLEGNPLHPASLGATDIYTQGSLLQLYDPDRSQAVRRMGDPATWEVFLGEVTEQLRTLRQAGGAGLRILTGAITSPTLASQLARLLKLYPQARIHQHEPAGRDMVHEGARMAFGQPVNPVYHLDKAKTIVSLDSNFLQEEPGSVRYAREFSDGRRVREGRTEMNRLYVVESTPTITGANADHRLPLAPSQVEAFARALAGALGVGAAGGAAAPQGVPPEWLQALAKDLQGQRGASLIIPGAHQSAAVHALAHAMNNALGNVGTTVTFTAPVEANFGAAGGTLKTLVDDMRAGRVRALFILGSNPVYNAPADLDFTAALQTFSTQQGPDGRYPNLSVHLGLYEDETSVLCQWHIPESHYLEAWGDARAYDGTVSIIQPLVRPLYNTRSASELLAVLVGQGDRSGYDIVRDYWMGTNPAYRMKNPGTATSAVNPVSAGPGAASGGGAAATPVQVASPEFTRFWHRALHDGIVAGTAAPASTVAARGDFAAAAPPAPPASGAGTLELVFRPDPSIWDGSFSNNGWLQELPKPLTSLTWDNAVLVSPRTAESRGLSNDDMVELGYKGRTLKAAVMIVPGHPDGAATLTLGYGRTRAGKLGTGMGFNAYALRTSDAPWSGPDLDLRKLGSQYRLATTQRHFRMEGRDLVRHGNIEEFAKEQEHPPFMRGEGGEHEGPLPSLYKYRWPSDRQGASGDEPAPNEVGEYPEKGYLGRPLPAWGMVIDLNACIGCNTCSIACQAENNIATVGKDQVVMHREMHWIRVDNYYMGGLDNPDTVFQPVPCMHCEKAPCEPVCPVEATTHSAEGINEMTYNRCIGTRYCQNNCPYKVRRFNFLQYSDQQTPAIQMLRNPDVTVRSRGVMEKCTYCIQRINEGRIEAEKEERPIRDGEVLPACAQACPTKAIIFGDVNDRESNNGKGSQVRQLKEQSLNYGVLTELNTRPRTTYLARLRNPNPELAHLEPREEEGGPKGGLQG